MATDDKFEKLYEKQLEFLTELNSQTKEESRKAFQKANDTLNQVGKTEEKIRSYIKKVFVIVVTIISFFGTILTGIGIFSIFDVKKKYDEFNQMAKDSKVLFNEINNITNNSREKLLEVKEIAEEAKVTKEIFLDIKRSVDDTKIKKNIDQLSLLELSDASIRYRRTIQEIWEYIQKADKYDYLVLFEAINNYIELTEEGGIDLDENELFELIKASTIVIKKCNESDWRTQLNCRNFIVDKGNSIHNKNNYLFDNLKEFLNIKIASANNQSIYKWNLVIVLSKLKIITSEDLKYLDDYIIRINSNESRINEPERTWLSCASAIELIQNKKISGWEVFSKYFNKGTNKQKSIAILMLSLIKRNNLESLGINKYLNLDANVDKFVFFNSLLQELEQNALDIYSKKYYARLIKNMKIK